MQQNLRTPFRATMDDGRVYEAIYTPVDVVAAERFFKGLANHELESTWYMGFHALKARRAFDDVGDGYTFHDFVGELADWLEGDEAIEAAREIGAAEKADTGSDPAAAPGSDTTSPSSASEQASVLAS